MQLLNNLGRSRDFSKGGHTVSNIIVMAFSSRNIIGCFLKKGIQRGGHGHPRTPLATPLIIHYKNYHSYLVFRNGLTPPVFP